MEEAPHHFVLSFFLVVEENKSLGIAQVRAFLGNSSDSLKKGSSGLVAKKKEKEKERANKKRTANKKKQKKNRMPRSGEGSTIKNGVEPLIRRVFFLKEKEHKVPMKMKCFLFFRRFFLIFILPSSFLGCSLGNSTRRALLQRHWLFVEIL